MSEIEPRSQGEVARSTAAAGRPRTSHEIRRDIEVQRTELGVSVEALRDRVSDLTDWRRQLREHRQELIVGAAAAGFVIGGIIALRRRR
ncbi:MAG TPA: DUF3618 domain-containing protein [Solirubrobacterales bacterium]|nr:DUF3618 domain-containing protein [Solirubrobacterales bacterium]